MVTKEPAALQWPQDRQLVSASCHLSFSRKLAWAGCNVLGRHPREGSPGRVRVTEAEERDGERECARILRTRLELSHLSKWTSHKQAKRSVFKGWASRLYFLMRSATKSCLKGVCTGWMENWRHFCNQSPIVAIQINGPKIQGEYFIFSPALYPTSSIFSLCPNCSQSQWYSNPLVTFPSVLLLSLLAAHWKTFKSLKSLLAPNYQ